MKPESITLHTRPVKYKFRFGGSVVHHSTVILSKSRHGLRQALKRLWLQHPHIQPD